MNVQLLKHIYCFSKAGMMVFRGGACGRWFCYRWSPREWDQRLWWLKASSSPVGILLSRSVVVEGPAHCGWYHYLSWVLGVVFCLLIVATV